jgi:alkaline phosphatase D
VRDVNRRIFILGGLATGGLAAGGAVLGTGAGARFRYRTAGTVYATLSSDPFQLGIASGDPTPDGVVLWTRLALAPLNADGQGGMPNRDVQVDWQLALDEAFTQVLGSGPVTATYAAAHSVHVELSGLQPGAEYFYRFRAEGYISPVGRTRTAPALDAVGPALKIVIASCSHYESGYFTVYRRMAEESPDLMLHLGDYIYEDGPTTALPRRHATSGEIYTLADYRARYGQYKSDPDLQAAHAAAPWLVVWDDHEVEDNYATLTPREGQGEPRPFVDRRADAYQAYYEHMPLRASSAPAGTAMQLYRRIRWGQLATFHMLDTRQYRSNQACSDGSKVCPDAAVADRTITGGTQETWLLDGLAQHYGTWDVIGQQVFFARLLNSDGGNNMDAWDGYLASRGRVQQGWVDRLVRNPVVLTGDVHSAWANDLKLDYLSSTSPVIGTELVASSVSTGGDGSATLSTAARAAYEDDVSALYQTYTEADNPHVKFHSALRGHILATMDSATMRVDFRAVDKISVRDYPARTLASFVVEDGRPGLQPA